MYMAYKKAIERNAGNLYTCFYDRNYEILRNKQLINTIEWSESDPKKYIIKAKDMEELNN